MNKEKKYSFSEKFIEGETKEGFWSLVFYGATVLNSFLIVGLLSVYEYGLYQLIISVAAIAESLSAGFVDSVVSVDLSKYFKEEKLSSAKRIFWEYFILKVGLAALLSVCVILGSKFVAGYYHQNITLYLQLAISVLIFRVAQSALELFFKSRLNFSLVGAPVFGEAVKFLSILFFLFWQGFGVTQVMGAYIIGNLATFSFSSFRFWGLYSKTLKGVSAVKFSILRGLLKNYGVWFSVRFVTSRISASLRPWLIRIFLNTEAVGYFIFARNIIAMIVRLMPLGTLAALLPRELDDKNRMKYIFTRMTKYSIFLAFVLALFSAAVVPVIVYIAFPKYIPSLYLFWIMTGIVLLYGVYKILRMMLTALKEIKILTLRSLDESLLSPIFLAILLPLFGVTGAAIEWVLTYALTTVLFFIYLIKSHSYLMFDLKSFFVFDAVDKKIIKEGTKKTTAFLKAVFRRKISRNL
ncbi:MAG: polysaccharide biosynthesis C-terminal domain-containing protein [Minisyncoccia bacterium]